MASGTRSHSAKIQSQLQFQRRPSLEQQKVDPNHLLLEEMRKLRMELRQEMKDFKTEIRQEIRTELKEINQTVEKLTMEITYANQRIDTLEQKTGKVEEELQYFREQKEKELDERAIQEQKIRERCVKIRGLSEMKEENLMEIFVPKLAKFLEREEIIFELEIDRIFRLNSSVARQKKLPRDVVVYFVRKQIRDQFLRYHNETPFEIDGKELQVFKDVPPRLLRKRKDYAFLTSYLKDMDISYRWINPEGLTFWFNKKRLIIKTTEEAKRFWEWLEKKRKAEKREAQEKKRREELDRRKQDKEKKDEPTNKNTNILNKEENGEERIKETDLEDIHQVRREDISDVTKILKNSLCYVSDGEIEEQEDSELEPELEWEVEKLQQIDKQP